VFFCQKIKQKPQKFVAFWGLYIVYFFELVNPSTDVNNFLFAREEWVTFVANVNFDCIPMNSGTCFESVSTSTSHCHFMIIWMSFCFHFSHLLIKFLTLKEYHKQNDKSTQIIQFFWLLVISKFPLVFLCRLLLKSKCHNKSFDFS
jgi:hypothetical protein